MMEWIELTKVNGEIDAQLVAGSLENAGIPTQVEKSTSAWRYGASDPFVLIAIYVPADRLEEAAELLEHPAGEDVSGLDASGAAQDPAADPFVRSRPLRWWVAVLVLLGSIVALMQADVLELLR